MFKTFLIGIVLGVVAAASTLYAVPLVDQYRESSIIAVAINGGTTEEFHVNIPMDRIMIGAGDQAATLPEGMAWPDSELFANVRTELFKVRNARDTVIGIASRTAVREAEVDVIDWVIHLPARGSLFVSMAPQPQQGGYRVGAIEKGTREFEKLSGEISERWVADTTGEEGAPAGRLELNASYIGELEPLE
ncbi:MAG: hypothetical protein AAFN50_04205 [Pseudomonadota bacterium]